MTRGFVTVWFCLLLSFLVFPTKAQAQLDSDEVAYRSAPSDAPDPFNSTVTTNTLTSLLKGHVALSLGGGEGVLNRHYFIKTTWVLSSGATMVRTLQQETEIFPVLDVPPARTFINVDHGLVWNGKNTAGAFVADGAFTYTVQGSLIRRWTLPTGTVQETILATTAVVSGGVFVDTVKPVATITQPPHGSGTTDATPSLAVSFSDASPSSSIDVSSFVGTLDGNIISNLITTTAAGASYTIPTGSPLTEGSHTFTATVKDSAGNLSVVASSTFTVDHGRHTWHA